MTSIEWKKIIDDLTSEITTKERRLGEIVHEKVAAILEPKKLTALEQEESAIPALIEQLKRRLPLLALELEGALRAEAVARYGELEKVAVAAAAQVSESTAGIREAMQALLDRITEAHADREAYRLLVAELEFLRIRFALPPLQIPPENRVTPEQFHGFTRQYEARLRASVSTQPWDRLRAEFQEAARYKESQRRAVEEASRPNVPHYIHYHRDPETHA